MNIVILKWSCEVLFLVGDAYFSGTERNRKLKFSIHTHLTHINTIFEYYHAPVNLDNADVLYLEDVNVHKPVLEKENHTYISFSKNF